MDASRFDRLVARFHRLAAGVSRRRFVQGVALGAALSGGHQISGVTAAKQNRCRKDGRPCRRESKRCQARYCLAASFTISAIWTSGNDHDTYLFVPKQNSSTGAHPYIYHECNPGTSACATSYPFACVDQDAGGPGNEVTTIRKLLDGKYEYWIELFDEAPAGDLTVELRQKNGRLIRRWQSPVNPDLFDFGWHVFDIDGKTGSIKSVNTLGTTFLPDAVSAQATDVCPV